MKLIVAASMDDVIAVDGQIPWHIPEDLKLFRKLTIGHTVVMGRKTYESIGGLLPGRENIILTRNLAYNVPGALVMHAAHEVTDYDLTNKNKTFIIGGADIYAQFQDMCDEIHLSRVTTYINDQRAQKIDLNLDRYTMIYNCDHEGFIYQNYRAANIAP